MVEELSTVQNKWEHIGKKLSGQVVMNLLYSPDDIRSKFSNAHDCLEEMIRQWLQRSVATTWGHIIDALRSIGDSVLADHLKAKYLPGELTIYNITVSRYILLQCHYMYSCFIGVIIIA